MLSHIPEPFTIDIQKAHIRPIDLAYRLSVDHDLTLEVVFRRLFDTTITDLVIRSHSVDPVLEVDPSSDLVDKGATPERVLKAVRRWVERDTSPVIEDYLFAALDVQVDGIQVGLG